MVYSKELSIAPVTFSLKTGFSSETDIVRWVPLKIGMEKDPSNRLLLKGNIIICHTLENSIKTQDNQILSVFLLFILLD